MHTRISILRGASLGLAVALLCAAPVEALSVGERSVRPRSAAVVLADPTGVLVADPTPQTGGDGDSPAPSDSPSGPDTPSPTEPSTTPTPQSPTPQATPGGSPTPQDSAHVASTAGLDLQVFDVRLSPQPTAPGQLRVHLTNSGTVPGPATVSISVPAGVGFGTLPTGCTKQKSTTVTCTDASIAAGTSWDLRVSLFVPVAVRSRAPLAGLVRAALRPAGRQPLQAQASYQILATATAASTTASADASPSTGQPVAGVGLDLHDQAAGVLRSTTVWPIISGSILLLIVVIIGLALTLRRRREEAAALLAAGSAQVADGGAASAAPAAEKAVTAVISAGPVDRTATPRGPISWQWTTGEEPVQAGDDTAGAGAGEPESAGAEPGSKEVAGEPEEAEELSRPSDVGPVTPR